MRKIEFIEVNKNYFDKKYKYKIYTNAKVYWTPNEEKWFDLEDKEWMREMKFFAKAKYGNKVKFQGAVIYCESLDEAFTMRLVCGERINKIEKAIGN